MTTDAIVLSNLIAEVALRQLPSGGWAALRSSAQPAIEPSCYCALALGSAVSTSHAERAFEFLLQSQNRKGSWPTNLRWEDCLPEESECILGLLDHWPEESDEWIKETDYE